MRPLLYFLYCRLNTFYTGLELLWPIRATSRTWHGARFFLFRMRPWEKMTNSDFNTGNRERVFRFVCSLICFPSFFNVRARHVTASSHQLLLPSTRRWLGWSPQTANWPPAIWRKWRLLSIETAPSRKTALKTIMKAPVGLCHPGPRCRCKWNMKPHQQFLLWNFFNATYELKCALTVFLLKKILLIIINFKRYTLEILLVSSLSFWEFLIKVPLLKRKILLCPWCQTDMLN